MFTFPFNPSGTNEVCRITEEDHRLTVYNDTAYFFLIPKYAPFFANSVTVYRGGTQLLEGTDYNLIMPYVSATRATGKSIYAGLSLNLLEPATITINYSTIGGNWVQHTLDSWRKLAILRYNPRHCYYDEILNKPEAFPTIQHRVEHRDFAEFGAIINSMGDIATAIAESRTNSDMMEFLIQTRNNRYSDLDHRLRVLETTP
jgi:hypothetical protein